MANTFLNTGRTVAATSNPETNIEQVNNANQNIPVNAQQPVQTPQSNQSNAISPITIPIQIQPQVAQTTTNQTNNNVQQLQTNSSQQKRVSAAPTPQTYNTSNTSNNVVDFNQIYSSYQSTFGNNQNTNNTSTSGIKKTSIGTTIVTPTNTNMNTVQGQYQSEYSDTINSLISEMLTQMKTGFQYDPTTDGALKVATEYAANSTLQNLAGSGVLNSSATAERVARIVSELIPTYEEKAHDRWGEYLGQLADTAQIVMNYDAQQFEHWKDAKDREFQEKQFEYQKQQDALENAWKRVDELGYVDNKASQVLGVKVGTLSGAARLAKEQQEYELAKMREQAEIEYKNNVALYKLKSELDTQQSKILAEYDYTLQQKHKTKSSSNTTSLSTYKDVINNRWGKQDMVTGQYTISNDNNEEVFNFLDKELDEGRLSDGDAVALINMYGIYDPNGEDALKKAREKYIESLGV